MNRGQNMEPVITDIYFVKATQLKTVENGYIA